MADATVLTAYKYQTDEQQKKKHHWTNNYAGFVQHRRGNPPRFFLVGKCPVSMSNAESEALLQGGVPVYTRGTHHPHRIYAVRDGVVYEARPTVTGVSYHGYPAHPEILRPGPKALPEDVRKKILELAIARNELEQVQAYAATNPIPEGTDE